MGNLALLAAEAGELDEALGKYQSSLAVREQLNDKWGVAGSQRAIGMLLWRRGSDGDAVRAAEVLRQATLAFEQVNDVLGIAECCETLGLLHAPRSPGTAARLLGAAIGLRRLRGAATDVVKKHEEAKALRTAHGGEWEEGERAEPHAAAASAVAAAGELLRSSHSPP